MAEATAALAAVRRLLAGVLAFGMLGLTLELVLLEHFESLQQRVPLALLLIALPLTLALLLPRPPRWLVYAHRGVMLALVLAAALGLYFHYTGNAEFELELEPSLAGWPLVRESLHGATPALAPGTLMLYGLIGLIATWRHSALAGRERA